MIHSAPGKSRLPLWAEPENIAKRRESKLAPYRSMPPEQRAEILAESCRLAMVLVNAHPDPEETLRRRVELPESSRRLLARLRARYRGNDPRL